MKALSLPHGLFKGLTSTVRYRPVVQCRQFRTSTPFADTDRHPLDFSDRKEGEQSDEVEDGFTSLNPSPRRKYRRLIPASPSYFTTRPGFTDDFIAIKELQRKCSGLPRLPPDMVESIAWKRLPQYSGLVGDRHVPSSKYKRLLEIMNDLMKIHPAVMPPEVQYNIERLRRDTSTFKKKAKPVPIDKFGRALGNGSRKSSRARAWVVEGDGQVLINGKTLATFFGRVHDRESAVWALKVTNRLNKYNVWALTHGGGTTGQAEAMTMAVANGLLAHEPLLKPALRRAGCVTRDPRKVERKKHGRVKARKMPTWVKR